ncbi:MAG: UDP-N-acetylglucosamine 2-epimerase (non-hydrolyzing), partial [Bdellovibrionales bacterium CG22_combo_CG10-13_8_21_14_all_38_13]
RPEAISAGCSFMVGTNQEKIVEISNRLLNDSKYYDSVSKINNPYGDGNSSIKILESLESLN